MSTTNILKRRDMAVERARERIDAMRSALQQQMVEAMRPSQEELRARFEAAAQDMAAMDVFRATYGEDEFVKQWSLYLKRQEGVEL